MDGEKLNVVGRTVPKVDGVELVTGKAQFAGDLRFSGMLHAVARRAGVPAGKIRSIDLTPATGRPGVRAVLTAGDIPGPNIIGILPPFDQPLLATGEIRYEGESLALVVAESREAAKRGAAAIGVEIDSWQPMRGYRYATIWLSEACTT